jgi:excisionase family DNA binding protein
VTDERRTTDRRKPGRPRGGRRVTDPIDTLEKHTAPFVTVVQLSEYWRFHPGTIVEWIKSGRLPAIQPVREYRIKTEDALVLERELFKPRSF